MRLIVKWLVRILAVAVVLPVTAFALVLAALQTEAGRRFTESTIESLASSGDSALALSGLEVGWGLDTRLDEIRLGDREGDWLAISGAEFDWSPWSLALYRLEIDRLRASTITVHRQPLPAPAEEPEPSGDSSALSYMPSAVLRDLTVDQVVIDEEVLGTPLAFDVNGRGTIAANLREIGARLMINRLGADGGEIDMRFAFAPQAGRLDVSMNVSEPRDGLMANLMDLPTKPAIDLSLEGGGPLSDWKAQLRLALDGKETVTGDARLVDIDSGQRFVANLDGALASMLPNQAAPLFAGTTRLAADVSRSTTGRIDIAHFTLTTDAVNASASGIFDPEGSHDLTAQLALQGEPDAPVVLALSPTETAAFRSIGLEAVLRGPADAAGWSISGRGLDIAASGVEIADMSVNAWGSKARLDSGDPFSTLRLEARADITGFDQPAVAPLAVGTTTIELDGTLESAEALDVASLIVRSPAATARYQGRLGLDRSRGKLDVEVGELAKLAELTGQTLQGSVRLSADIDARPNDQSVSADIELSASEMETGIAQADDVLGSQSKVTASLSADGDGQLDIRDLEIESAGFSAAGSARLGATEIAANLTATINDLAVIDPRATGSLSLGIEAGGPIDAATVKLTADSRRMTLMDQAVEGFSLAVDAVASADAPAATLRLGGTIGGKQIDGSGELATAEDGGVTLDGLKIAVGETRIVGDGTLPPSGVPTGQLKIVSPDLAEIGPLILTELAGSVDAEVVLTDNEGSSRLTVAGTVQGLEAPGAAVSRATIEATVDDLLSQPSASGRVVAEDILAGGQAITMATVNATTDGSATGFDITAALADGNVAAKGRLAPDGDGLKISLEQLTGSYRKIATKLKAPTEIAIAGGSVTIAPTGLALGGGELTVQGSVADELDLKIGIGQVPLNLVNLFVPGAGVAGTVSGNATVSGSAASPAAAWNISWAGATAAALQSAGLPKLAIASKGRFADNALQQTTTISGPNALELTLQGPIRLDGPTLNVSARGQVPLALAGRALAEAGIRVTGTSLLDINISGNAASPRITGNVSLRQASVVDLGSSIAIRNISGKAELTGDSVRLSQIDGKLGTGGHIRVTGTIGLPPAKPNLPADIKVTVADGRYGDGKLVAAEFTADLGLKGELLARSDLAGTVRIQTAEISIPDSLPGAIAPVAVTHKGASGEVQQQAQAIRGPQKSSGSGGGGGSTIGLNIKVEAPGRLFVRGRGLDAEMGGTLLITGTTADPRIGGGFSLERGRLSILNQRFDFDSGDVTFGGGFDPYLDFAATTSTGDSTTVTVAIAGLASDPGVTFSSVPSLPDEEVLARLLFDRDVTSLSPVQAAQLAAAVATLAGGGRGKGLFDRIRSNLGLSNLDVTTDADGETSVSTGTYVGDNIYLDVEQTTSGESRATINLDITKGLKARGGVDSEGGASLGIFFEREY